MFKISEAFTSLPQHKSRKIISLLKIESCFSILSSPPVLSWSWKRLIKYLCEVFCPIKKPAYVIWYWLRHLILIMIQTSFVLSLSGDCNVCKLWRWEQNCEVSYSISQEICTRFCCALLYCGYAIGHNEFTWSIYLYSSGLLCWHWGNG